MNDSKGLNKDLYTFQARVDKKLYDRFYTEVKQKEGRFLKWYVEDFMKRHLERVEYNNRTGALS